MSDRPTSTELLRPGRRQWLLWGSIFLVLLIADLWTKHLASTLLAMYEPIRVFPGLNMMLAHNYGAAFSFLSDQPGWQRWFLSILSVVISIVLFIWLTRISRQEKAVGVALAMVLAGAVGNLVDRVRLGYVVDFIDVYVNDWHWPAFNVADSAISVGVAILIFDSLFLASRREKSASA